MSEKRECPSCSEEYKSLGHHWRFNADHRPSFTDEQIKILDGIVIGDGCVENRNRKGNLRVSVPSMTTKEYVKCLNKEFGALSSGWSKKMSAEQSKEYAIGVGFSSEDDDHSYSDVYRWSTVCHPQLSRYMDWYGDEGKIIPDEIDLNPTTLKHWYCCDGNRDTSGRSNMIRIGVVDAEEKEQKLIDIFKRNGLPKPSNISHNQMTFGTNETEVLFDYMGESISGFEYKFP